MAANPALYSTTALQGIVRNLKRPSRYFVDRYFGSIITSDAEEIAFDVESADEGIAPFVAPTVAGRIILEQGFRTKTFSPAYIKIKTPLLPARALKRAIGERIGGGEMTAGERDMLRLAATLILHQNRIVRRLEAMASECLREGQVTVSGDGYATKVVDYGRNTGLRTTLTSGSLWTDDGADPLSDIEDWAQDVFDASGAVINEITMGTAASKAFRSNVKVQKLLDIRRASNAGPIQLGPMAPVPAGSSYLGMIGNFSFYGYGASYKDETNTRQRVLPDNGVLGVDSANYNGIQYYGAILDEEAGLQALQSFVKSKLEFDPSVRIILTQTAPLVAPGRIDTNFYASVL